jgi:hypothetical protein
VGLLGIGGLGGEHVDAHAQRGNAEKLVIETAFFLVFIEEFFQLVRFHLPLRHRPTSFGRA